MTPSSLPMGRDYWITFQYGSPTPVPVLPLAMGRGPDVSRRPSGAGCYLPGERFAALPARLRVPVLRAGAGRGLSGAWSTCGVDNIRRSTSSVVSGARCFIAASVRP